MTDIEMLEALLARERNCQGVDLGHAELRGAKLIGSILVTTVFRGADLNRVQVKWAC